MNITRVLLVAGLILLWIAATVYVIIAITTRQTTVKLPFDIPPGVRHVIVDCGTFTRSHFFSWLEKDPSLFLIGIEPQPRHRALHPKHPRFVHLPYAVGSEEKEWVEFHIWSDTGASLNKLGDIHARALGAAQRTFETIRVPMVTLDNLLGALSLPILLLKTDVQGADLDVLRGASKLLQRPSGVAAVVAECQDIPNEQDPRLYYKDGCKTNQLIPYMTAAGFAYNHCILQNPAIAEVNCFFAKEDAVLQRVFRQVQL